MREQDRPTYWSPSGTVISDIGEDTAVAGTGAVTDAETDQEELTGHSPQEDQLARLKAANRRLARETAELRRMVHELRRREQLMRTAVESTDDAIVVQDVDGKFLYHSTWSRRADRPDILGKTVYDLYERAFADEMTRQRQKVIEQGESTTDEVRIPARGRYRWFSMRRSPIRDANGDVIAVVTVARNIDGRKKAERELARSYRKERSLRKALEGQMVRRAAFIGVLLHELKTPLTPMIGASESLLGELKDPRLQRMARNVHRGATNLNHRISELVDLAKGDIGTLQLECTHVDVCQVLRETADYVEPQFARKRQLLTSELPDYRQLVWADGDRLGQVVLNLLENASRYTPNGSKVCLRATVAAEQLTVEVSDTGPGIPHAAQKRLFSSVLERKTREQGFGGLGMGLPLCKTLVELHGGRIGVRSEPGQGSVFYFSIPLRRGDTLP